MTFMVCLVACRVACVAEIFAGPLKSFLSELLQIDVSRITIFSFSLARRLRGNLRRLMALAVDYSVQVENTKVEEVVTEIVSGNTTRRSSAAVDWGAMFKSACCFGFQPWSNLFDAGSPCFTPTRRSELQETLQQDLAQMNITVEVVDVQVTQTSLEKIDQTDKDAMASTASTLFPALMMCVGAGVICGVCLCGCVAIVRWRKKRSSRNSRPFMPSSLPTIHGHLDAGVKKNHRKATASASEEIGPVASHL